MGVEHIKHWTVGDVRVSRIVELNAFEDDLAVLLDGGSPELMKKYDWLTPNFATPEGRMLISFQAFVIQVGDRNIMLDTCIGNDRDREFDVFCNLQTSFFEDLTKAICPAEKIDTVVCTHLHIDHVGWNTQLVNGRWVPSFPNARYLLGRAEWEHWQKIRREGTHHIAHLSDSVEPIIEAGLADFIEPNHRLTDEVRLEPTPGHTPGHVSVHIASRGQTAVITGDLVHHPIQLAEPDRYGNFDMDKDKAVQTRREYFKRYENKKALVIGSHFCDPTSGWVMADAKNWRWVPE